MASPTFDREKNRRTSFFFPFSRAGQLLPRRCGAWIIEVSLVTASAVVPYSLGVYTESRAADNLVPLNPVIANVEGAIAQALALPRRAEPQRQVPPLSNLFWWAALLTPTVTTGWQLYLLGKTGQTTPKRWLGVRVVTPEGTPPGFLRSCVREGIGRYGAPMGAAYLIWRYTGAFPDLSILLGLTGLMILAEGGMWVLGVRRRTWHDRLADTLVLNAGQTFPRSQQPYVVEVQSDWTEEPRQKRFRRKEEFTTIVLSTHPVEKPRFHFFVWMRQHPGITLLTIAVAGMVSILGTFVGTQIYIQGQANRREFSQQSNSLFLALVEQLSSPVSGTLEEQRAAILAMARLDDPRATPMLVDLLAQESDPTMVEALQQAIVGSGPSALPYLQRLNQSLSSDLNSLQARSAISEGDQASPGSLHLQTTQRAIAKLLTLYSGQIHNFSLDRTYLTSSPRSEPFTLVLDNLDLSGISFRGANLAQGSFRSSRFYGPGPDGRFGTFDDLNSDLSGADLRDADLHKALLNKVAINRTNLMRANLSQANLSQAQLVRSNLSSANLTEANFTQATLENASLTGATLAEANLSSANLQNTNSGQVKAAGANFSSANLRGSNWQGADLTFTNFEKANLQEADLSLTYLKGANLTNAQLQNANLRDADLSASDLRGANLAGANFQGVHLTTPPPVRADQFLEPVPSDASVAQIQGVNFARVRNLSPKQLEVICRQGGIHPQCPS